jgi:dihydrofolate synthase/folylpolyglutamate synthase
VITNIGLDHMNLLGNTIEEIAAEKAGIIKANTPVIIGPMRPAAQLVMEQKAAEMSAPTFYANKCTDAPEAALKGIYQEENRKTACTALRVLREEKKWAIDESHINSGFANVLVNTGLQGRWQIIHQNPLAIADVAHNQDGLNMVLRQISQTPHDHLHFVLGMVADKDISIVLELLPKNATYYFCKANIPRGMQQEELKEKAAAFSLSGNTYPNIRSAYESALKAAKANDLVFVGGSIFTVAEVL